MAGNIKGIVIDIGGNTAPLNKALQGVNKTSRNLQSELKQVDRLLKLDPHNTELVAQKQTLLKEAISNTKDKLSQLKEAEKQVQEQVKEGKVSEEQYRAFQREIVKTEEELKALEKFLKNTNNAWKEFGDKAKDIGDKATKIGKGMSVGITAPITAIGAASQVAWKEVDDGLDTIVTKTGASGDALDGLQKTFSKVYSSMPVDAQSAGDAIGELNTQFGLTGSALESASEQMLKFSNINDSDVTVSTQNAKGAIEAFGLSTKDLGSVLDAVTATSQKTGVGVDQLFDSVTKGAPSLKALGLNFAESTELMGRFEQSGIDSNKALSYLSKAAVTFAKNGKTMSQGLSEVSDKIKNSKTDTEALTIATEYFGTKGATFMVDAIKRGALNLSDLSSSAENVAGTVTKTFEGTLDPIDKATVAMNNLKLVGADLGGTIQEALAPVLEKVVGWLQKFVEWFGNLDEGTKTTIVILAGIVAALGPLLIVIGQLITAIGAISTVIGVAGGAMTILTGPIGITIAAITALIAVGVLLYKNWDTIKEYATNIWTALKDFFVQTFTAIGDFFKNIWNSIKDFFINTWNSIKDFFSSILDSVSTIAKDKFGFIFDSIRKIFDSFKLLFQGDFKGFITGIWDYAVTWANGWFNIGKSIVTGVWQGISGMASWLWDKVTRFFSNIVNGVKDALGIHSPSTVFRDVIGKNMALGIGVGFEKEMKNVAKQINKSIPIDINMSDGMPINTPTSGAAGGASAYGAGGQVIIVKTYLDGKQIAEAEAPYNDKIQGKTLALAARGTGIK